MHDKKKEDSRLREVAFPLLGKWVPFILLNLIEGPRHFADLANEFPGISRKVLTENLTNLVASGIIYREGETSTGYPVYYGLTELGESGIAVLLKVKKWLKENETKINANREEFYKNQ